jgi:hypothetical protein
MESLGASHLSESFNDRGILKITLRPLCEVKCLKKDICTVIIMNTKKASFPHSFPEQYEESTNVRELSEDRGGCFYLRLEP